MSLKFFKKFRKILPLYFQQEFQFCLTIYQSQIFPIEIRSVISLNINATIGNFLF